MKLLKKLRSISERAFASLDLRPDPDTFPTEMASEYLEGGDALVDSPEVSDVISVRGAGESGSPLLGQGDRVWVWFCTKDGRAVEVSNIDRDEFSFPGKCKACGAPLSEPHEYVLLTQPQPESSSGEEGEAIPRDYWREVPCGHPPDPVAMYNQEGLPVCHCARVLDLADRMAERPREAPGPIVYCGQCGCYVAIAPKPTPTQPLQGSQVEREENWFSTAEIAAGKPEGPWIGLHDYTALRAKLQRVEEERDRLRKSAQLSLAEESRIASAAVTRACRAEAQIEEAAKELKDRADAAEGEWQANKDEPERRGEMRAHRRDAELLRKNQPAPSGPPPSSTRPTKEQRDEAIRNASEQVENDKTGLIRRAPSPEVETR